MSIVLSKYQGTGNDYLILDPNRNEVTMQQRKVEMICRRNFGVGSDGILYGPVKRDGKIFLKIYNPDGSEAERSGNGIRIFAKYLLDRGYVKAEKFLLSLSMGGEVEVSFLNEDGTDIEVNMGRVDFASEHIPVTGPEREVINEPMMFHDHFYNVTCLAVGNPHCVIMMEDVNGELARELGPYVERDSHFPNRMNMQLLKVVDRENICIEIYERGTGYTLASGSSACAAAAAAYRMGLTERNVTVHMPGGALRIRVEEDYSIHMRGSVGYIGEIILAEDFFA